MLLLEGYTKQIYIDRATAARGGPGWQIRVTNDRGRTVTYAARAWQLRPSLGGLRGCGGLGDEMLAPGGPAYWVETTMAIEADVVEKPPIAATGGGAVRSRAPAGDQLPSGPERGRAIEA